MYTASNLKTDSCTPPHCCRYSSFHTPTLWHTHRAINLKTERGLRHCKLDSKHIRYVSWLLSYVARALLVCSTPPICITFAAPMVNWLASPEFVYMVCISPANPQWHLRNLKNYSLCMLYRVWATAKNTGSFWVLSINLFLI